MCLINPGHAVAAKITVVFLCVCLFDYSCTISYEVASERYQQLQSYEGMNKCGDFAEMIAFERYGVKLTKKQNQPWLTSTMHV